ncbi:MAG TPA: thiamine pyrophosphate-dependent enzyme, partial [Gemmatimonadaceae bacterium]|nr:thiamine pyrophosphate-dependent enzyme [Gemmatimonadaceae bacterium]
MSTLPITSVFNDGYIADLFDRWRRDPNSVDESWRQFFAFAQSLAGGSVGAGTERVDAAALRKAAGAAALMEAIRTYGHLGVRLDPLGIAPAAEVPELRPETHGITEDDLAAMPALHSDGMATAAEEVAHLRSVYSSTIGFEFEHIEVAEERAWLRRTVETGEMRRALSPDEKRRVLERLTQVDGLERFLGLAYQGAKRFSIEGTDMLVPMLDAAIETAGAQGAQRVVIGMAHRGRINVLAHILDKPYGTLFEEFEGKHAATNAASDTGDVKYHLGRSTTRTLPSGETVDVTLVPNPSHLEFVNPVLAGLARALQRQPEGGRDERSVLPVVVHGDAAFPGEGVVAESFNLSALRGYRVGGTLHIIANNQVGFTTDPLDSRSTFYASDLAKGFEVPIVHVNADDPESCIAAVWLALAYRERFGKDFLIDLVGYRRYGHNEQDEPMYTQPKMYEVVKKHPRPREVWAQRLAAEGVVGADDAAAMDRRTQEALGRIHDEIKSGLVHHESHEPGDTSAAPAPTVIQTALKGEQ